MKKSLYVIAAALLLACFAASWSLAADAPPTSRVIKGEVVSTDPDGKTVVIRTADGEEVTVVMTTPTAEVVSPCASPGARDDMMACELLPVRLVARGTMVQVDCFDSGGKFCANRMTVFAPKGAKMAMEEHEVMGEVTAVDPLGKTVVIRTPSGEKTLYYQKVTKGAAMDELAVGKKVRALCLDIEGKSCIRQVEVAE